MDFFLIALTSTFGAILTFFCGFGLGTLMLPIFSIFFPMEIAVLATAIVHFTNNLFKFGLVFKSIDYATVLRFGIPAILATFPGALLLSYIGTFTSIYQYTIWNLQIHITPLNLALGFLMIFFALFELLPRLSDYKINQKHLPLGGILSGFFGGLSGHQGAFRAAFLSKSQLTKELFIGTSTAISLVIDLTRITTYAFTSYSFTTMKNMYIHVTIGVFFAFTGSIIGKKLLTKTTFKGIQRLVGILLIIYGLFYFVGIF
jgi:uncharacterized membrane protein YfcA